MGVSFHLIGAMSNDDGACGCGRCSGLAGAPHCAPLLRCGEPIGTRRFTIRKPPSTSATNPHLENDFF